MTSTRWLRISAVISFLFATGHKLGGRKLWSPMGENAVLEAMRSIRFPVLGVERRIRARSRGAQTASACRPGVHGLLSASENLSKRPPTGECPAPAQRIARVGASSPTSAQRI